MNQKKISIIIVVLVIILITGVVIYNNKQPKPETDQTPIISQEVREAVDQFKDTLTTKHQYKDGEHIFLGSFEIPNPCYDYNINVKDLDNEKIIMIEYVEPITPNCPIKTPANKKLLVTFRAPIDQIIKAKVNNEDVNLNIIEVPADEDIVKFEI